MKCLRCGIENNEGMQFCKNCGTKLNDNKEFINTSSVVNQPTAFNQPINNVVNQQTTFNQSTNNVVNQPTVFNQSTNNVVNQPTVFNQSTNNVVNQQTTFNQPTNNVINNQELLNQKNSIETDNRNNIKKIIIIGVIVVLIVICVVFGIRYLVKSRNKYDDNENIFNSNGLIPVKKDNKYGYIDLNGDFVIQPLYDKVSAFQGNYATVELDGKKGLIDKKGNLKEIVNRNGVTTTNIDTNDVTYNSVYKYWIIDSKLYDENLNEVSDNNIMVFSPLSSSGNGKYLSYRTVSYNSDSTSSGVIDASTGKITYTHTFEKNESSIIIVNSSNITEKDIIKENYCTVYANNKTAIINCDTGKQIYDFTDKTIMVENNNIFVISEENGKYTTLYIKNDKIKYQASASYNTEYGSGYVSFYDDNYNYIYFNLETGETVSELPSNVNNSFSGIDLWEAFTKFEKFSCDEGYGLKEGNKVKVPCEWYDIEYFNLPLYKYLDSIGKKYILAEKDQKTYLVDVTNGSTQAEFNSNYVKSYDNSTFINYEDSNTGKNVIYNLVTGKSLSIDLDSKVFFYPNHIIINEENKLNYYNENLKLIYTNVK